MPLHENAKTVQDLLAILNPRIIGKEAPGWSCNCGCIKGAAAVATEVCPAGSGQYAGQETCWAIWNVKMEPKPGELAKGWYCGLSKFIPIEEIKALFLEHFGAEKVG